MSADRPWPEPPAGSRVWVRAWDGGVVLEFPRRRVGLDVLRLLRRFGPAAGVAVLIVLLALVALPDVPLVRFVRLLGATVGVAAAVTVGGFVLVQHLMNYGAVLHDADGTRELRVNVDGLSRIGPLGRRHVWAWGDIVDVRWETYEDADGHFHGVVLRTAAGERVVLHGRVPYHEPAGPRRAELEWIAAVLRQALRLDEAPPVVRLVPPADAITERSPHVRPGG